MKTYLHSKFDGRGIQVHVIGFRLEDLLNKKSLTEEEQLEADGYKAFGPAVEDIGGTFEDVESADKLAAKLQEYFLQVRFWVEYDTGDPVDAAAREGMQVTATNKNIRPTIHVPAPADYHVLIEALRATRAGPDTTSPTSTSTSIRARYWCSTCGRRRSRISRSSCGVTYTPGRASSS